MKDESVLNISVAVARAWFWRRFFGRINVADKPAATRGSIVLLRLSAPKETQKDTNAWKDKTFEGFPPCGVQQQRQATPGRLHLSAQVTTAPLYHRNSPWESQLNPPHPPPHPRTAPRLLGTPTKRTPRPPPTVTLLPAAVTPRCAAVFRGGV